MRASPPVRLAVAASSLWRLAIASWGALLALVLVFWAVASLELTGLWVAAAAAMAVAFAALVTVQLLTIPSVLLAWDGQCWRCAEAGFDIDEAAPGTLQVCLDLGGWMLVRHTVSDRRKHTWIPIQQDRRDPAWHLFRCALYSARPEVGGHPHDSPPGASGRTDTAA